MPFKATPMRLRVRAGAVLVQDGGPSGATILLVRHCQPRHGTYWLVPGGGVEPGEQPCEAAVREMLEETGLEIEVPAQPAFLCETLRPGSGELRRHEFYAGTITGGALQLGEDRRVVEVDWVPVARLLEPEFVFYPDIGGPLARFCCRSLDGVAARGTVDLGRVEWRDFPPGPGPGPA